MTFYNGSTVENYDTSITSIQVGLTPKYTLPVLNNSITLEGIAMYQQLQGEHKFIYGGNATIRFHRTLYGQLRYLNANSTYFVEHGGVYFNNTFNNTTYKGSAMLNYQFTPHINIYGSWQYEPKEDPVINFTYNNLIVGVKVTF